MSEAEWEWAVNHVPLIRTVVLSSLVSTGEESTHTARAVRPGRPAHNLLWGVARAQPFSHVEGGERGERGGRKCDNLIGFDSICLSVEYISCLAKVSYYWQSSMLVFSALGLCLFSLSLSLSLVLSLSLSRSLSLSLALSCPLSSSLYLAVCTTTELSQLLFIVPFLLP